ncbi:MAG: hypothetical protein HY831_05220 [Candidatus Aenigmarchaeota archaeon]|nr:hypothetical protein [Candidatus Aenigmarchaeota archaeon]
MKKFIIIFVIVSILLFSGKTLADDSLLSIKEISCDELLKSPVGRNAVGLVYQQDEKGEVKPLNKHWLSRLCVKTSSST